MGAANRVLMQCAGWVQACGQRAQHYRVPRVPRSLACSVLSPSIRGNSPAWHVRNKCFCSGRGTRPRNLGAPLRHNPWVSYGLNPIVYVELGKQVGRAQGPSPPCATNPTTYPGLTLKTPSAKCRQTRPGELTLE